eukprot:6227579-Prorocentrum_lima.AAC.1
MHVVIEEVGQLENNLTRYVEITDSEAGGEVNHEDERVEVVPSVQGRRAVCVDPLQLGIHG